MIPHRLLALFAIGAISACDSTIFGDAEPDLDNPFTRGSTAEVEESALANPLAVIASQRYPGTLYALADEATPTLYALDDNGRSQGRLTLEGITRQNWRDLALQREGLLILGSSATAQNVVYRFVEPSSPPPFDGSLSLFSAQSVFLNNLDLSSCEALGTASESAQASLLCGQQFYRFELDENGGTVNADEAGTLPPQDAEIVDFSISPAGQFAILSLGDQLRVGQSDTQQWDQAFANGGRQVNLPHDEFQPANSSFAFNGVLLHTLGSQDQQGLIFTIFNP